MKCGLGFFCQEAKKLVLNQAVISLKTQALGNLSGVSREYGVSTGVHVCVPVAFENEMRLWFFVKKTKLVSIKRLGPLENHALDNFSGVSRKYGVSTGVHVCVLKHLRMRC